MSECIIAFLLLVDCRVFHPGKEKIGAMLNFGAVLQRAASFHLNMPPGRCFYYWDEPVSWLLWQMPAGSTHIHWLSRSRKGSAFLFVYLLSDRVPLLVKLVRLSLS